MHQRVQFSTKSIENSCIGKQLKFNCSQSYPAFSPKKSCGVNPLFNCSWPHIISMSIWIHVATKKQHNATKSPSTAPITRCLLFCTSKKYANKKWGSFHVPWSNFKEILTTTSSVLVWSYIAKLVGIFCQL